MCSDGQPHWDNVEQQSARIQHLAAQQLLKLFKTYKDIDDYPPLWGDEVEYQLVSFDDFKRTTQLLQKQEHVLKKLRMPDIRQNDTMGPQTSPSADKSKIPDFQPEFGSFMVESTPGQPYDNSLSSFLNVQRNMRTRRQMIQRSLESGEAVITMPGFPRLAAQEQHAESDFSPNGVRLQSQFFPDELISTNERYSTIHDNMRARRRGRTFKVKVPIYKDAKTPWPWKESKQLPMPNGVQEQDAQRGEDQAENFIYGDSMSYGPSCCGLQVTMQARHLREARYLHDQLCPLGPVLMALTAATPFFRGFLTDTDLRWNQSALAVDDRTTQELKYSTSAPRWSSSAMYISNDHRCHAEYNKPDSERGLSLKKQLQDGGMDGLLALHYANILAHDPIALTKDELQSHEDTDLFEIMHSAVWPHVDFKAPSSDGTAGWRVEFRPLEVQPTDFENAAFAIFVALLARTILYFDLNFYVPMEKVEENMQRAHTRDAVVSEQFLFRRQVQSTQVEARIVDDEYAMMTIDEIINGSQSLSSGTAQSFPGLIPLVQSYIQEKYAEQPEEERRQILKHLDVIRKRATGELLTPASWMRRFVHEHEEYKQDSIVPERVCFDLMRSVRDLGQGHDLSGNLGS